MWTEQEIAEHNARVKAFRAEHHPRIEAMTDALCRRIYKRWTTRGEGMNAEKIALEFKGDLSGTWLDSHEIGIGIKIVHVVLERLGKFDDDFRPRLKPVLLEKNFHGGRLWYLPAEGTRAGSNTTEGMRHSGRTGIHASVLTSSIRRPLLKSLAVSRARSSKFQGFATVDEAASAAISIHLYADTAPAQSALALRKRAD